MTRSYTASSYTAARLNGRTAWTPERLDRLRALCVSGASYNDLEAAFPAFGMSTLLVGMRKVIAEMAGTAP